MKSNQQDSNREVVKEFAAAVSTQSQVTNRVWLVLITVALFAILPQKDNASPDMLKLPLGLGQTNAQTFWTMMFALLIVLTIAFCSAYVLQFRAQSLVHKFINRTGEKDGNFGGADLRQWFDILRVPTFNRVSPLAQLLRVWLRTKKDTRIRRFAAGLICALYYLFLKFTAMLVYFGLPVYALYRVYGERSLVQTHRWTVYTGFAAAVLGIIQAALCDVFSLRNILPHIWRGDSQSGT